MLFRLNKQAEPNLAGESAFKRPGALKIFGHTLWSSDFSEGIQICGIQTSISDLRRVQNSLVGPILPSNRMPPY
jgi:hypothetical protein